MKTPSTHKSSAIAPLFWSGRIPSGTAQNTRERNNAEGSWVGYHTLSGAAPAAPPPPRRPRVWHRPPCA